MSRNDVEYDTFKEISKMLKKIGVKDYIIIIKSNDDKYGFAKSPISLPETAAALKLSYENVLDKLTRGY